MAVIFNKKTPQKHYQVRKAGNSLRLYTNGVFHSQFNSRFPFKGHLWDLMSLPVLTQPQQKRLRVLVLGVGGGAVISQIETLVENVETTAVELDPVHIDIAQTVFGLKSEHIEWCCGDAVAWLKQSKRRFDVIIDDCFGENVDDPRYPVRAVELDKHWLITLQRHLTSNGCLLINTEGDAEVRKLKKQLSQMPHTFQRLFSLSLPQYENAVAFLHQNAIKTSVVHNLFGGASPRTMKIKYDKGVCVRNLSKDLRAFNAT